jgi:hypothetical protein
VANEASGSFYRNVRAEFFPQNWTGDISEKGSFGERG